MIKEQYLEVSEDVIGQRVDNHLIGKFSKLPKPLIYRWIRKGQLRVNKKRVKQTTRVSFGDIIRIPPFIINQDCEHECIKITPSHLNFIEKQILYETDDYIVVNKPSGIAVHGGSGISSGLVERLRQLRPDARRLDLVHRLDKGTSGCVLLAKKHSSLVYFFNLFKQRKVNKIYCAVVCGYWDKNIKTINLPLRRTETKDGQRLVKVDKIEGKNALTNILSVKHLFGGYSLLEIKIETGRTHQIRVHCKAMGYPIVGDKKFTQNKLILHAWKLEFFDNKQQKNILIKSKLDSKFNYFLKNS